MPLNVPSLESEGGNPSAVAAIVWQFFRKLAEYSEPICYELGLSVRHFHE